jgi:hypothetical protein
MQAEIDSTGTAKPVRILGVNAVGQESDNALICEGRSIPWLQDTGAQNVWSSWQVNYRDVVILDAENRVLEVYNLTQHDLAQPANYTELKDILSAAAQ